MTGLASSFSHMACTRSSACAGSSALSQTSIVFPMRKSDTSSNPRVCSAFLTASPWGSSTPGFSFTVIVALITDFSSQPSPNFAVRLHDAPQVPAKAILVQLLFRPGIPKAARIRRDLVRQQKPALPVQAELQLEIHQHHPALLHQLLPEPTDAQGDMLPLLQLIRRRQLKHGDVVRVDQGIPQLIAL